MSTIKGRKERQGFFGYQNTFANAQAFAASNAYFRLQMEIQEVQVLGANGQQAFHQPHALGVVAAGMKCAAVVGLSNLFKLANITAFKSPSGDFNPETDADTAIEANICFIESAPGGGFRFGIDNTLYGANDSTTWYNDRTSVIYAGDVAARTIRLNTEQFVGKRNSDISAETIKNALIGVMDSLRASGIIVPDTNSQGKGYTNLSVLVVGSVIYVSVTLVLVENYEFVLNDITVQRAASAA
jgi:hypothetical protein